MSNSDIDQLELTPLSFDCYGAHRPKRREVYLGLKRGCVWGGGGGVVDNHNHLFYTVLDVKAKV